MFSKAFNSAYSFLFPPTSINDVIRIIKRTGEDRELKNAKASDKIAIETIETIENYVSSNPKDINEREYGIGDTALILAVRYGLTKVVNVLLKAASINANALDHYSNTALMVAVTNDSVNRDIIATLLRHKIDINVVVDKDGVGRTPLTLAIGRGERYLVVVQDILPYANMEHIIFAKKRAREIAKDWGIDLSVAVALLDERMQELTIAKAARGQAQQKLFVPSLEQKESVVSEQSTVTHKKRHKAR